MEEAMARGDKVAAEHYISWANSLRLDLAQLGLARRKPPAMDLQAYLRQRAAEKAESKLPTGGNTSESPATPLAKPEAQQRTP